MRRKVIPQTTCSPSKCSPEYFIRIFVTVGLKDISDLSSRDGKYMLVSSCKYSRTHPISAQKVKTKILYCGGYCTGSQDLGNSIPVFDRNLAAIFCTFCGQSKVVLLTPNRRFQTKVRIIKFWCKKCIDKSLTRYMKLRIWPILLIYKLHAFTVDVSWF